MKMGCSISNCKRFKMSFIVSGIIVLISSVTFKSSRSFRQLHRKLRKRAQAQQQKEIDSKLQQLQLKHEEDLRRLQLSQQVKMQQLRVNLQQGHAVVLQNYKEKHAAALEEIEEAHNCISVDDNEIEHASPEYASIIASLARKYVWLVYELDRFTTPEDLREYVKELVQKNEDMLVLLVIYPVEILLLFSSTQNLRFTRPCHVCSNKDPPQRVVYVECGCVVCRDCAEGFASENISTYGSTFCLMCMVDGGFMPLFEERNEET